MIGKTLAPLAAAFILTTSQAQAVSIDTSAYGFGYVGDTTAVTPEATLVSLGSDLFLNGATGSVPGSFCATESSGSCGASLEILFNGVASDLVFEIGGHAPGKTMTASIFDASNTLLASLTQQSNGPVSFLGHVGITRLFIDESAAPGGYGYGTFSFTLEAAPETSEVPLPASGLLLAFGAASLISVRRKARKPRPV